jgi:hypothetical protein
MPISTWLRTIRLWSGAGLRRGLHGLFLAGILVLFAGVPPTSADGSDGSITPVPLLAYYSISYEANSWNQPGVDSPVLGRYSSDDAAVMREHIHLAQQAGVNGFIVNWKNMPRLNQRLEQLLEIADGQDFKLAIAYQALDPQKKPVPASKVAADLDYFQRNFAGHAALTLFDKPVIIWSGTWAYSPEDIASVTGTRRKQLLLLASERSVSEYQMLAPGVDGNAYYWPSANPASDGYAQSLRDMGAAVHSHGGIWIAPAAPGYQPRPGGGKPVDRADGATLRQELAAALAATPDAVGLISWNVFQDSTQVEPGVNSGRRTLDVLADVRNGSHVAVIDFDSSEPGDTAFQPGNLATLGGFTVLLLVSLGVIVIRNRGGK